MSPLMQIDRVLCPVDRSEVARRALKHATFIAREYVAELEVLEVAWAGLPPVAFSAAEGFPSGTLLGPELRKKAYDDLERFVANGSGPKPRLLVREGMIAREILAEADDLPADLIVMGTHGRTGLDRFVLGSVTETIIRRSPYPVVAVPPNGDLDTTRTGFKRIIAAVDFSLASERALKAALTLAERWQSTLVLAHILDFPPDRPIPPGTGADLASYRRALEDHAKDELQRRVPDEARLWCQAEEIVRVGRPHEELVRLAEEQDADLIVMGAHARSALALGFLGSTTNQVLRHAHCPVLTIRT